MTVLVIVAVVCLAYAIYRSTGEKFIITDVSGRQIFHNEPQHGLILGLCVFAGLCILGVILMVLDRRTITTIDERTDLSKRTL